MFQLQILSFIFNEWLGKMHKKSELILIKTSIDNNTQTKFVSFYEPQNGLEVLLL